MSKSGKKPEKKAIQKIDRKTNYTRENISAQLREDNKIVEMIVARNQKDSEIDNQKDYELILHFIRATINNYQIDMEGYENLHFTNRLEYLIAKAILFSCVPQKILSGITNPPSVEELKKNIEKLVIFLYRENNLNDNQYRIDQEIINQIVKDFEVTKVLI